MAAGTGREKPCSGNIVVERTLQLHKVKGSSPTMAASTWREKPSSDSIVVEHSPQYHNVVDQVKKRKGQLWWHSGRALASVAQGQGFKPSHGYWHQERKAQQR
jgi:hypothetical protein